MDVFDGELQKKYIALCSQPAAKSVEEEKRPFGINFLKSGPSKRMEFSNF